MNNCVTPVVSTTQEAWKSESPKPRRRSIIREFALNTSTHGLPGIARSESKHNCIFWTISFLIFGGIMIYFVYQSIKDYFEYPTQTSISIVIERSQTFPAVTFCNYAPARHDLLIVPFLNYTNSRNLTNTNDTSITAFTFQQALMIRDYLQDRINSNQDITAFLFSLDTMLMNCTYNGESCGAADFISFLSSKRGRCYTFNAKTKTTNGSGVRYTNKNGGTGNLVLRLYTHNHLYTPYITEGVLAGMVAMIHDNTELPLIDVAGIELTPGRKHKLGYKKKTTYFLPSPYTDCTNKIPLVMQAMFKLYEGADYAYSQGVCYTLCTQAYIYQECGCVNPYEWSARSVVDSNTNTIIEAPLCNLTDRCYANAGIALASSESLWNEFCSDCTQQCSNINFVVTPSAVAAPSLEYAYITKGFVESVSVPLPTNWQTNWPIEIQNNYVSIEVVCESTQVENYTQDSSVSAVDVLSNVGGHTGLWIGISFLSIMEFVEMLYRVLRYEFHTIRRYIRNRSGANH